MGTTFWSKANRAKATLDSAINDTQTTFDVTTVSGYNDLPSSGTFAVQVGDSAQGYEIMTATRSGATLTVTRAQEGTSALPFDAGTIVDHLPTAGASQQLETAINQRVEGPASATDHAIVRFDGTDGKKVQNSLPTIDDSGNVVFPGNVQLGDNAADVVKAHGMIGDLGSNVPSRLFRAANPKNLIANGDFETWLGGTSALPTGWGQISSPTVAKETTTIKRGKASAKITGKTDSTVYVTQISPITPTLSRNRTWTFGTWVWADAANKARLTVAYGTTPSYATKYHTGSSSWELLTLAIGQTSNATNFAMYLAIDANDPAVTAYFDGAFIVEGPEEWAFESGDDRLGNINLPLAGWWDYTDTECLDVADTDPALGTRMISWTDADTDQIATSAVIPSDYDSDANLCWFIAYYSLGAAQDNVTLDLETFKHRVGAGFDNTPTTYDHTADPVNVSEIWNGDSTTNIRRVVYKLTETLQAHDVLDLVITRVDDGVADATLHLAGTQLMYVK